MGLGELGMLSISLSLVPVPPFQFAISLIPVPSFLEVQEVWQIVLLANPVLNQLRALLGLLQFGNWE